MSARATSPQSSQRRPSVIISVLDEHNDKNRTVTITQMPAAVFQKIQPICKHIAKHTYTLITNNDNGPRGDMNIVIKAGPEYSYIADFDKAIAIIKELQRYIEIIKYVNTEWLLKIICSRFDAAVAMEIPPGALQPLAEKFLVYTDILDQFIRSNGHNFRRLERVSETKIILSTDVLMDYKRPCFVIHLTPTGRGEQISLLLEKLETFHFATADTIFSAVNPVIRSLLSLESKDFCKSNGMGSYEVNTNTNDLESSEVNTNTDDLESSEVNTNTDDLDSSEVNTNTDDLDWYETNANTDGLELYEVSHDTDGLDSNEVSTDTGSLYLDVATLRDVRQTGVRSDCGVSSPVSESRAYWSDFGGHSPVPRTIAPRPIRIVTVRDVRKTGARSDCGVSSPVSESRAYWSNFGGHSPVPRTIAPRPIRIVTVRDVRKTGARSDCAVSSPVRETRGYWSDFGQSSWSSSEESSSPVEDNHEEARPSVESDHGEASSPVESDLDGEE